MPADDGRCAELGGLGPASESLQRKKPREWMRDERCALWGFEVDALSGGRDLIRPIAMIKGAGAGDVLTLVMRGWRKR
jgi:hypothetical protein